MSLLRSEERVTLKLPRNLNLDLEQIAGHVSVGPTEGMVRLESIAGHVSTGELQAAEMSSLARGLSMEIKQIGKRGVRLSSIIGVQSPRIRPRSIQLCCRECPPCPSAYPCRMQHV